MRTPTGWDGTIGRVQEGRCWQWDRIGRTPLNPNRLFAIMFGLPAKDLCTQCVAVVHPEGVMWPRVVRRIVVQI
jgi:hypothetical protein